MNGIKLLFQVNWLLFLFINFSRKVKRNKGCFLFPYHKTKIRLNKGALMHIEANVYFGLPFESKKSSLIVENNGTIVFCGTAKINAGCYIKVEESGHLEFGDCSIAEDFFLNCSCSIKIGNNFLCSRRVTIRDNDGHELFTNGKKVHPLPIVINDNVWLCQESMILKGVVVGNNVVIGAKALITKPVSSNVVCICKTFQHEIPNSSWKR